MSKCDQIKRLMGSKEPCGPERMRALGSAGTGAWACPLGVTGGWMHQLPKAEEELWEPRQGGAQGGWASAGDRAPPC